MVTVHVKLVSCPDRVASRLPAELGSARHALDFMSIALHCLSVRLVRAIVEADALQQQPDGMRVDPECDSVRLVPVPASGAKSA